VAFGTVLLPTFAGFFAKNDLDGARGAFVTSTRHMLYVMIPAAFGLGVLAPEVTDVIYRGGAFDAVAVKRVSRAVCVYAIGLGFFGLQKSLVPWFQAQNDMKTPLRISVWTVCLNATLNVLAVALLPVEWRHVGLAASTVFCAACGCVLLALSARRRNGPLGFSQLIAPVSKIVAASLAMSLVIFAVKKVLTGSPTISLLVCVVIGGLIYFAGMTALGMAPVRKSMRKKDI
jgi:putative peptidoglycan lipid II flippase